MVWLEVYSSNLDREDRIEYNEEPYHAVGVCTRRHKTASSLATKQLYMPVIAPVIEVTSMGWTRHLVQSGDSLGVSFKDELLGPSAGQHHTVECSV